MRIKEDPLSRSPLAKLTPPSVKRTVTPASYIWQVLNPDQNALVHIRIESPTILVLNSERGETSAYRQSSPDSEKPHRTRPSRLYRWWNRAVRPIMWLLKIVVLPMTATTAVLYVLLLYLLKDAELLEAQRNRAEPDGPILDEPPSVEDGIGFSTLPRAFPTDVELLAASKDGLVVAAVGMQNELVIWRTESRTHTIVDTSHVLLGGASTPSPAMTLTALAVNDEGTICAAGTGAGVIATWRIGKDYVERLSQLSAANTLSPINQVCFLRPKSGTSTSVRLIATYENNAVLDWDVNGNTSPHYITPSRSASVIKSVLLSLNGNVRRILVGFSLEDGTFELCEVGECPGILSKARIIAAGNPTDLVTKVAVCNVKLEGSQHLIIAAVTQAGVISLWDGNTQECVFIFDELFGDVGGLHILPVPTKTCVSCGEVPPESFSVSFSVGQVVLFHRAYLTLPTRQCSCPHNQPQQLPRVHTLGHRSRSSSVASVASSTGSTTPRSRTPSGSISSALNGTMFPISAHGILSRRASDVLRRNLDSVLAHSDTDESETHPVGPQEIGLSPGFNLPNPQSSFWQSLVVVGVASTTFERGNWTVENNKVVGIRRRPRPPYVSGKSNGEIKVPLKPDSPHGLTPASLERWELWTFDPSEIRLQASALADISQARKGEDSKHNGEATPHNPDSPRLQSRRRRSEAIIPRLHFTRVSPFICNGRLCLAGFGNTVGVFLRDQNVPAKGC